MKIKNLMICAGVAAYSSMSTAANITETDAAGYFERGKKLYDIENYAGAIDQLSHLKFLSPSTSLMEEADFYIAMSKYNSSKYNGIEYLKEFLTMYPASLHTPDVFFNIGNKYFYAGKYGEAVVFYSKVDNHSLDIAKNNDMIYRKAYSELRLGNYDEANKGFIKLADASRYKEASTFYRGYICYVKGDYDTAVELFNKVNTRTELGDKAQYYLTQINFTRGEFDKVIDKASELLAKDSNPDFKPELNRLIGESYFQTGDDNKAEEYLDKYLSLCNDINRPARSAYYVLGIINQRNHNYDKVIEYMDKVTGEDDVMSQSAYLYCGQAYTKKDNNSSAIIAYEKAMNMSFDLNVQETAFFNYAIAQGKGSRTPFSRTIDYFEEFINRYPSSRYINEVEDFLINAYITGNDYNRAYESISHINKPSQKVIKAKQYVLYNLGVNAYSNSQRAKALELFKEARALGDFNNGVAPNCDLWIGDCYYNKDDYDTAEKYYTKFINATTADNANYSQAYYNLGYAYFQKRNYSAARSAFEKAIANNSKLRVALKSDAICRIGDTYYYNKDYDTAARNYAKAQEVNPDGADYALFQEAIMDGLRREYTAKVNKLDELITHYPNSPLIPSALLENGATQATLNNNNEAMAIFERLVASYAQSSEGRKGLLQLAITLRNNGKTDKAIANYERLITRYPSSEEAQLAVEDLKVIYSEKGQMDVLQKFLEKTPNAPKINISEYDRLTFDNAEKAFLSEKEDVSQLLSYIQKYPAGAYVNNAEFYIAQHDYNQGKYDEALNGINEVLKKGKDAAYAEDALAMKGNILMKQKNYTEAHETFSMLATKATTPDNRTTAQLGLMRAANSLNNPLEVINAAANLLSTSGITADEEKETIFLRATALSALHRGNEAEKDWTTLAADTRNIYGAQAAYSLADYYYNNNNYKQAEKTLNSFIDSGTSHQYWLARGFILLSDVYAKQGKTFEAREYLESLKNNYPGKESDIFDMIDSRLKTLKK